MNRCLGDSENSETCWGGVDRVGRGHETKPSTESGVGKFKEANQTGLNQGEMSSGYCPGWDVQWFAPEVNHIEAILSLMISNEP